MRNRIAKKNVLRIDDEVKNDRRLSPLLDIDSKILFQIYVLEIKNLSTTKKEYKIIYGWCIKTARQELSPKVTGSKEFTRVFKTEFADYSINKLNIFNTVETIINVINNLLAGNSFLEATKKEGLETNDFTFDLKLPINDIVLRPIIFNESNSLISRNPYEKNVLISPYKTVPSFSLIINNLYKEGVLTDNNGDFYDKWDVVVLKLLNYLQEDTTLPFKTSSSTRFGNIELINTQCSNEFEVHNVWYECLKEEVNIDYGKKTSCKKIKITIEPNIHTCNKNLLVNCFILNGQQVILDECKKIFHSDGDTEYIEFESKEPISKFSISIWLEENGSFQIWYKNSAVLVREISSSIGIVGKSGVVKSPWLDLIKNSNSKTKKQVSQAEKISRTSYNTTSIGGYSLDPWVKSDRNFSFLINQLSPEKTNAEFFSKGWDSTDESYGAISFLEWFKRISDRAQKVIIQDPFYDTLGLEFLARTTNAETEFSILTCTQVTSLDDSENKSVEESEPNRARRLKSFIKSNPSLFWGIKLNIYDIRSSGGGDNSIIHDRYLLIFEDDFLKSGYHLSNSIQGATKNHPLLITPIPKDVLKKVDNSINEAMEQTQIGTDKKIIPLFQYDKKIVNSISSHVEIIADENIYDAIRDKVPSEKYLKEDIIESIVRNTSFVQKERFSIFWSTFGHYLANTHYADEIIVMVDKVIDTNFIINVRKYLEGSINSEYPLGFSNKSTVGEHDFRFVFNSDFEKTLKESLQIEGDLRESYHGNWGVHYGCILLLKSDFNEYIKLIKFIEQQYFEKANIDLANSSLQKLSSKVFSNLFKRFFWYADKAIITKAFNCDIKYIQAIGTASLINLVLEKNSEIRYSEAKDLLINNLETDEVLSALIAFLLEIKFQKHYENSTLESQIFAVFFKLLNDHFTENRLTHLFDCLLDSSYPFIEKKTTELILSKLVENGKITNDYVFNLWSNEFYKTIKECKSSKDYSGIIDLTAWSLQIVDDESKKTFLNYLKKIYKKSCHEIREPFKKGAISWSTSFEKILLIRTVLIIIVLDEAENKSRYSEEIKSLIQDIEVLENEYQFNETYSMIYKFSKQMLAAYKS